MRKRYMGHAPHSDEGLVTGYDVDIGVPGYEVDIVYRDIMDTSCTVIPCINGAPGYNVDIGDTGVQCIIVYRGTL